MKVARLCCALLAVLLSAACASTPQPPPSRAACLTQLVHAYQVEAMINRSQSDSLAEAHHAIERVSSQYGALIARLSAAQQEKFEAATDRFVMAARTTPDTGAAEGVWVQAYAAGVSDEELRKIAEFSATPAGEKQFAASDATDLDADDMKRIAVFARTPAGQKQASASSAAATQLRLYLAQERSASLDKAVQRYVAELKSIASVPGGY
jgi:hypothetical protein